MSSGYSSLEEDAEDFFFTARTSFFRRAPQGKPRAGQQDVEKEKETHNYLSKEEIQEKVHKYNLAVTDKLKMTLNSNGIYTGFIKVQMELCSPPQTSGKLAPSSNGCMNTLHISSTNTVGEVIEALLKKFLVTESPAKFALYKRCHREDQVYACKLSDREHPLYLRLVAGPRTDTLSFVLREHEIGEGGLNLGQFSWRKKSPSYSPSLDQMPALRRHLSQSLGSLQPPGAAEFLAHPGQGGSRAAAERAAALRGLQTQAGGSPGRGVEARLGRGACVRSGRRGAVVGAVVTAVIAAVAWAPRRPAAGQLLGGSAAPTPRQAVNLLVWPGAAQAAWKQGLWGFCFWVLFPYSVLVNSVMRTFSFRICR
ncbi:ras association domain-containing protein 3 isoform X1 [Canis lupus familiaris]|uniref:Ras association domain-containing protein 3 n=1 Tax=Canis lupus familiaris TaxID=9615 RepID=A0A8C0TFD7_CANLF|nr:ras association domain-containing protein 3 isoform X1 [Canis lupus dingo]XP_038405841.1 ras association domain-containing protein 3 isoform X1 [Canis lupus familiaris]XP_038490864.1 ras association domain-containing protein 3 isoform X1 [Canis lupus familiaris]XP_038535168.1 ras association domain-containing protein 3 isoform X1 [Canis lupus familiaris]